MSETSLQKQMFAILEAAEADENKDQVDKTMTWLEGNAEPRRYIVTGTSMVVEAYSPNQAIDRAQDTSGWNWEATEVKDDDQRQGYKDALDSLPGDGDPEKTPAQRREITVISIQSIVDHLDGRGLVVEDDALVAEALGDIDLLPTDKIARVRPPEED